MRKIVNISIEVDMNSPAAKKWEKPKDYFESEVDEVLEKLSSIDYKGNNKYVSKQGKMESGNRFKVVVAKDQD